jgi:hypothetical protein
MERRTADNLPNPRTREDFLIGTGGTLPSLIEAARAREDAATSSKAAPSTIDKASAMWRQFDK